METDYSKLCEPLFERECYVIDFLPRRVSGKSAGRYFSVEAHFSEPGRISDLYRAFADIVLRLYCCYDIAITDGDGWVADPAPSLLEKKILDCAGHGFLNVLLPGENALIALNGGDLYMTLYAPGKELLRTVKQLASGKCLFVRKGIA